MASDFLVKEVESPLLYGRCVSLERSGGQSVLGGATGSHGDRGEAFTKLGWGRLKLDGSW